MAKVELQLCEIFVMVFIQRVNVKTIGELNKLIGYIRTTFIKFSNKWSMLLAVFVLAILSFAITSPLLIWNILYSVGDLYWHYPASVEFSNALQEGYLYPRWMPRANLGLGQPAFLYYPPLLYYLVHVFNIFSGDIWIALKTSMFFSTWITGIFAYMLLYRITGPIWALIGATTLIFAPFFFHTLYYIQEDAWYVSSAAAVAVLYFSLTYHEGSLTRYLFLSISVAALVLTHSVSAFMLLLCLQCLPIIEVFHNKNVLFVETSKQLFYWYLFIVLGVGIGLIHLMPSFLGWNLINWQNYAAADWHSSFIFPVITYFLFGDRWFLYQWYLPLILFLSNLIVTIYLIRYPEPSRRGYMLCVKLACIGWLSLFFASELSYPLWCISDSVLQKVSYPTRFLYIGSLAIPLATTLVAYHGWHRQSSVLWRSQLIVALVMNITLTIMLLFKFLLIDAHVVNMTPDYLVADHTLKTFNPLTLGNDWRAYIEKGGMVNECQQKSLDCHTLLYKSQDREWMIESNHFDSLALPVLAFPAWKVLLNGTEIETRIDSPTGLIQIPVAPGKNFVRLTWKGIPVEHLGTLLSVLSAGTLAMLLLVAIWKSKISLL
jgi:hypothetical protein